MNMNRRDSFALALLLSEAFPGSAHAQKTESSDAKSDLYETVKETVLQWRIQPRKEELKITSSDSFESSSASHFSLFNFESNRFLQWEEQRIGVNLGWTDSKDDATRIRTSRWFVRKKDGSTGPVIYGEPLALGYGRRPSYYRYGDRVGGINLFNEANPRYEWIIFGGEKGAPVDYSKKIGILNSQVGRGGEKGDFLVRHYRDLGANIGWTTSPDAHLWKKLVTMAAKKAADAVIQKIISGGVL